MHAWLSNHCSFVQFLDCSVPGRLLNAPLLSLPCEQLKLAKEPHQAMIVDKDYERIAKVPLQVWPRALMAPSSVRVLR